MSFVNAGGVGVFGKWVDGDGGRAYVLKRLINWVPHGVSQLQVSHLLTFHTQDVVILSV